MNIDRKQRLLDDLYPNNYTAAMFLDEVEAAVRLAQIGYLKTNIIELTNILNDIQYYCNNQEK